MKNLTAILIDDEPHCLASIEFLLEKHFPEIRVLARCSDGEMALAALQKEQPSLVFMDVEMPLLNGFQVLERLGEVDFPIIFTTAYSRYAVRAFRFSALDFLLKPVDPAEFCEAVERAKGMVGKGPEQQKQLEILRDHRQNNPTSNLRTIALPCLDGLVFVDAEQIVFCESDGNYTRIHVEKEKPLLVSRPLKEMESVLEGRTFFRIHKQFLVNLNFVKHYRRGDGGEVEMLDGAAMPVARNRKEAFLAVFMH